MDLIENKDLRRLSRACRYGFIWIVFLFVAGCATAPKYSPDSFRSTGIASWYGKSFQGKVTASGEKYNMYDLTAAHPTLPFGVRVRVTHLGNKRTVVVRINDRGPFVAGRIIDLSYKAARRLDMIREGVAKVHIEVLD